MNHASLSQLPQKWSEARRRAEVYLRALGGSFGSTERLLVARALTIAREQHRQNADTHPVTLVMETLFDLLPAPAAAPAAPMTPPIHRATMLPGSTEFPVHDWLRRPFRGRWFTGAQ